MKQKLLFLTLPYLFIGSFMTINAQEAIVGSGGNASGDGSVSYSVGQVFYTTNTSTSDSVAQGVQQAFEISTTLGIENNLINLSFIAYPNPTNDFLTLKISNFNKNNMESALFDIQGRMLARQRIKQENTRILMQNLATGTYFLKVTNDNKLIKTFKIIKN